MVRRRPNLSPIQRLDKAPIKQPISCGKLNKVHSTKIKSNIDRNQETLQGRMVSMSSVDDYLGECLVELEVHFDHRSDPDE
jgi:hypothetical protein